MPSDEDNMNLVRYVYFRIIIQRLFNIQLFFEFVNRFYKVLSTFHYIYIMKRQKTAFSAVFLLFNSGYSLPFYPFSYSTNVIVGDGAPDVPFLFQEKKFGENRTSFALRCRVKPDDCFTVSLRPLQPYR